ncbi:MAG: tRNA pseudouridine(13) synthase TruD [Gammaproteobacteria bacterium]|nr:tRNA pseudouridine(13) synthase TruD [Gammaproteobacteria bacterium]
MTLPAFGFDDAPFAYGDPRSRADFKTAPEDFIVEEVLGFEPCGEGEHLFLLVQTDDQNTQYTLKQLSRHFKLAPKLVSYSGLKDRRGLTSQWFSLHLPGKNIEVDRSALSELGINLLRQSRHNKKLRIGTHKANRFHISLRNFSDDGSFQNRMQQIASQGVPNYFGPQRFGHHGHNVNDALHWVEKNELPLERELRSRVLSTLRAWLFNGDLGHRVAHQNWLTWQPGDPVLLDGSHSFFHPDAWDATLQQRLDEGDIHPSTWLWSPDHPGIAPPHISDYLSKAGLSTETRALRLLPRDLKLEEEGSDRVLHFNLPTGAYATSLLRELVILNDKSLPMASAE